MGFWKKVGKLVDTVIEQGPEIMAALQQEGAKRQASLQKETERRINNYERKVSQAASSNKMKDPGFARKVQEEKEKIERAKVKLYTGNVESESVKTNAYGEMTFGGFTLSQWDNKWVGLGILSSLTLSDLSPYSKYIGLYKAELNGKVVYLGRAIEYNNGGLRKRLRDYVRDSNSARTHGSGRLMHENADRLRISILVVGESAEDVDIVKALERAMISKYDVKWNVQHNRG